MKHTTSTWYLFIRILLLCLLIAVPLAGLTAGIQTEEVQLTQKQGILKGTLILPQSQKQCPVVLLIAGSGPTDRNGNNSLSGENNSLKLLAEGLAEKGIASLRYDKRGIGESRFPALKESDLTIETYIQDASQWIGYLKKDSRFYSVIVLGHSEGSLIGAAAARQSVADAFISVAGPGKSLQTILLEQLQQNTSQEYFRQSKFIISELEKGHSVPIPDSSFDILFRPSVQPYLISAFRYDPALEISKLNIPVLLVQGTHDIQVAPENGRILKLAAPKATLVMIDGMNHVLKFAAMDRDDQIATYSNPHLPVVPQLITSIAAFINKLSALKK